MEAFQVDERSFPFLSFYSFSVDLCIYLYLKLEEKKK